MAQQIDVALVDVPPVKHEDFLQFLTKYGETYFDSERLDAFHDMHAFHDIISHDPRRVQPFNVHQRPHVAAVGFDDALYLMLCWNMVPFCLDRRLSFCRRGSAA